MSEAQYRPTLLLVDDEEHILSALRRVLRGEPYELLTANGGTEALGLLAANEVDLVVSDARMPGLDGPALLAEVQQRWPGTLRLMLTGATDLDTSIRAINQGQIYRYLGKPWNDDELRFTLRQALAHQHAEREHQRLERLTLEQNQRLQELNASLEQRVRDRTAELQQTADMLDLAYDELRHSYVTATEVFSSLLSQRLPGDKQGNAQVIALVRAFANEHQLPEADTRDLAMAAALYNLGKLTWDDHLLNRPSDLLHREERERYCRYPQLGESLLMALEPLHDAGRLIRHHQERWNGTGFPDQLHGEVIPYGARLLKLAVDFVELQCGLVLQRPVPRPEALQLLARYAGRLYDPALCRQFIDLCTRHAPDLLEADPGILAVDTRRLEPGMVLTRNLRADSGMLLLNAGKQLSRTLIDKLIAFEASEGARYTLHVRLPEAAGSTAKEQPR
ncbi:HD domain-containing phosphohydrolase [Pseudomonas sp. JS3066]|jgi:response regulator RpfG family c-di-GMP phosphodiesterase|uniref:HD domain-containing phosphohydrolase n=1 Tax=unclassified Pseudomonas TaxID=196821 RepID=UPI000EA8E8DA|nr:MULTISPECIES: HD domain-containing phosphohydrolase [unclassified Pseudomonas]AYF86028.1 response regulator [Pseudomonas sp. DY-1]MDH4651939.1 response regulator [Pseudomonas sp. BN606]MRK24429.1 response regulator [Pseudomonas sp. JG-B]WVK91386.1 HD domain-containing phosphohydrolase [Pseudomonas sp. JS3066]